MDRRATELAALAAYDFEGRSEDDVRGDWIEPLLRLLGYGLGTRNDVRRGETLALRPPFRAVGRKRLDIDFRPTVLGRGLWIIEAKKPVADLFADDHLVQMWTYGTDPRVRVPLGVLCDGQRIGVFDLTQEAWDEPVVDLRQSDLAEKFDRLEAVLGARHVARWVRERQLSHLETALAAQVDVDALRETVKRVEEIVARVRPEVDNRRDDLAREAQELRSRKHAAVMERSGAWGLAQSMNAPFPPRMLDVQEMVEAIRRQSELNRAREFDFIEQACQPKAADGTRQPPRMWWPVRAVRLGAALLLADDPGCGDHVRDQAIQAWRDHHEGFPGDRLAAAAHDFCRVLAPTAARLVTIGGVAAAKDAEHAFRTEMDPVDWVTVNATMPLDAEHILLRQFNLACRRTLAEFEPWTVAALQEEAARLREQMPKLVLPPGATGFLAGDPWYDLWHTRDPLRDATDAIARNVAAANDASAEARALAQELLDDTDRGADTGEGS